MNRFPSGDELKYKFVPPQPSRFWIWALGFYRRKLIRESHNVTEYAFEKVDRLRDLVKSGARILIAPNHTDHADGLVLYELAKEVDTMFCHMATHQLFEGTFGLRYFLFPRCGAFPIDREGPAIGALRAAKDVLVRLQAPRFFRERDKVVLSAIVHNKYDEPHSRARQPSRVNSRQRTSDPSVMEPSPRRNIAHCDPRTLRLSSNDEGRTRYCATWSPDR